MIDTINLPERKRKLEHDIRKSLFELIESFWDDTFLDIKSIDIRFIKSESFGGRDKYFMDEVKVEIEV